MPTHAFRSIAKKLDVSLGDLERYWDRSEKSYERAQQRAKEGKRDPVRQKYPWVMAATLRQAQRTGANPHTPLSPKKKKDKEKSKDKPSKTEEAFAARIEAILETLV